MHLNNPTGNCPSLWEKERGEEKGSALNSHIHIDIEKRGKRKKGRKERPLHRRRRKKEGKLFLNFYFCPGKGEKIKDRDTLTDLKGRRKEEEGTTRFWVRKKKSGDIRMRKKKKSTTSSHVGNKWGTTIPI